MKQSLRAHREFMTKQMKLKTLPRMIMPQPENVFEKRNLYKHCKQLSISSQKNQNQQISTESTQQSQNVTVELPQTSRISSDTHSMTQPQNNQKDCDNSMKQSLLQENIRERLQSSGNLNDQEKKITFKHKYEVKSARKSAIGEPLALMHSALAACQNAQNLQKKKKEMADQLSATQSLTLAKQNSSVQKDVLNSFSHKNFSIEHEVSEKQKMDQAEHSLQEAANNCENRPRSGSQTNQRYVLQELKEDAQRGAKLLNRRRNSYSKFRLFDFKDPSPPSREQQRKFAEALRLALKQASKGNEENKKAWEGDSTGHFSSIFTGDINNAKLFFGDNLQSEGAEQRVTSPIYASILNSRRGSDGYYASITRQRSQHSLIVESITRILDDTALDQRMADKEKLRQFFGNEHAFRTGPPSEVPQTMHEDQINMNSQFYQELENKWNHQFDLNSSNSLNAEQSLQFGRSQKEKNSSGQHQQIFASPAVVGDSQGLGKAFTSSAGAWNMSGSFYNSPYFLIPTHTSNVQHRSAAFHELNGRHFHSTINPFSLTGMELNMRGADTSRLIYNPHPLLPNPSHNSSDLMSAGRGTNSEMHNPQPFLSRTTSQSFIIRAEQKINADQRLANISQLQHHQHSLTQRNLEILNKQHIPSKDMLYAKIFTDFVPSSPQMRPNPGFGAPQHPISVNNYNHNAHHITPQSLFCFALDTEDMQTMKRKEQKTVSGFEFSQFGDKSTKKLNKCQNYRENAGVTTPTKQRCINFFGTASSTAFKVKDDSQARITTKKSKLEDLAKRRNWKEEIEQANQLANEANLVFNEKLAGRQRLQKTSIFDKQLTKDASQEKKDQDSSSSVSEKLNQNQTPTTEIGTRNFYLEYVKINESMRKSSGLMNYSLERKPSDQRRSSYSQGRASEKDNVDNRRKSFNLSNQKFRRRSPLGYRALKNPLTSAIKEISGQETDEGEHSEAKKNSPPNQTTDEEGTQEQHNNSK